MRAVFVIVVCFSLFPAAARATYISPSFGIASTLAEVGSQYGATFTVQSSVGTPGTTVPGYSPKAFTGPVMSSVNATASTTGKNFYIGQTGLASSNLATGQLKVGAGVIRERLQNQDYAAGTASSAALSDVLMFSGVIPKPVTIHLSMTVDGSIVPNGLGDSPIPNDPVSDIAAFSLDTNQGLAEVFIGNLQGNDLTFQNLSGAGGHLSVLSSGANSIRLTLTEDLTISSANRTVLFLATAQASPITLSSYGSVIADFEHTAALSIDLPDGLTYTSLSGVFLTQPQDADLPTDPSNTVPEPASGLVLSMGLVAIAALRSRRQ